MIKDQGKQAVWQHAKETGLAEGIAAIAKHFDIKDVCVIGNGKITYIEEMPRKTTRIAVATKADKAIKEYIDDTKVNKRR